MTHHELRESIKKIMWEAFVPKVVPHKDKDKKNAELMTKFLAYELGADKKVEELTEKVCSVIASHTSDLQQKIEGMKRPDIMEDIYGKGVTKLAKMHARPIDYGYNQALQDVLQLITERKD